MEPRTNTAFIDAAVMTRAFAVHRRVGARGDVVVRAIMVFVLVVLAAWTVLNEAYGFGVWLLLVAILFCLLGLAGNLHHRNEFKRQLSQMGRDGWTVRYEPTQDHYRCVTDEAHVQIEWSKFWKWTERDGLILAYRHDRAFEVIPVDRLDDATGGLIRDGLSRCVKRI